MINEEILKIVFWKTTLGSNFNFLFKFILLIIQTARPIFTNLLQEGYDRKVRPNYGQAPVTVGVSLYVLSVSELSEKFMDYTFDMYFRWGITVNIYSGL